MYKKFSAIAAVVFLTMGAAAFAQAPEGAQASGIGYPSVAAALEALKKKSGIRASVQGGWLIVDDRETMDVWSFTPSDHPAHPAAIRRKVIEKNGLIFIQMNILCQATKPPCDKLAVDFRDLNEKMRQDIEKKRQQKPR